MIDHLRELWMRASTRERLLLALCALVVGFATGYVVLWQPLVRDLAASENALREARVRVQWARSAVDEIAGLERAARAPVTADRQRAIERVASARGLRAAAGALANEERRTRITFTAIEFDRLVAFIDALAREEQLFVADALLAALVTPGSVRAELTFARPAAR